MQDSHSVTEYLGGEDVCLLGVYDGHGVDGAKVSQHLAKIVPQHLSEAEELRVSFLLDSESSPANLVTRSDWSELD